jgi:hypothetical protein
MSGRALCLFLCVLLPGAAIAGVANEREQKQQCYGCLRGCDGAAFFCRKSVCLVNGGEIAASGCSAPREGQGYAAALRACGSERWACREQCTPACKPFVGGFELTGRGTRAEQSPPWD